MRRDARSSGSGRAPLRVAAALALTLCAPGPAPRPQEAEDITGSIEKYRTILALANQKLDDLDLAEALARFTEVIDGFKAGKLPAGTPLTRQIVGQAYEGRARTQANLGASAEAEADFEALIRYDVTWPVDRTRTSPKIVALYDKVRKRIVGTLAIRSEPAGAAVSLNGEPIGRSPVFDRELTAGPYTLRIEAEGFDPLTETVTVEGGGRLDKEFRLTPNARSILVATSPPGARVLVDDVERGTTFGTAGAEYAEWAARMEVNPSEVSSALLVEHLAPGSHTIKIARECYEPQLLGVKVEVDPNDNAPVAFEPIRLSPSLGSLSLESTPPGAEALVDGKPAGRTPVALDGLCSGRHDVILRHEGIGQWIGTAEVAKSQRVVVSGRPRPTLAYVGMTEKGTGADPPQGETELGAALSGLDGYNVLRPGAGVPEDLLARGRSGQGDDLSDDYLGAVAARTGADLVVAARPAEGGFGARCEVLVRPTRATLRRLGDRLAVSLEEGERAGGTRDLLAKLSGEPALVEPWIGLRAIDLYRGSNPVVIRVIPAGPAAAAGVKVSDAILSLGGKPAASARDLEAAILALKPGAQVSITLQSPGEAQRQANIVVGATPLIDAPFAAPGLVSRRAVILRQRAALEAALGRPASAERTAALLSLGLLLIERGLAGEALEEALSRVEAGPGAGISAGTVAWLKGLALSRLGRHPEARQQLKSAMEAPDATMWRADGPPVAERARRLLALLPPG